MQTPKRRLLSWIVLVPLVIIGIVVGAYVLWLATPAAAMSETDQYLASDDAVEVVEGDWLVFRSKGANPDTGLVLYPGGRVAPAAYAPLAYQIAEAGYLVVIPTMPFNLAILDVDRAGDVFERYPDIQRWAVGGHSLGGAMAARYVYENQNEAQGLVLWAAYPGDRVNLSETNLKALSVYGSYDSGRDEIEASQSMMPPDTIWVEIAGGNHAQFGWYGEQMGDSEATISREEQQAQIIAVTIEFLASLSASE